MLTACICRKVHRQKRIHLFLLWHILQKRTNNIGWHQYFHKLQHSRKKMTFVLWHLKNNSSTQNNRVTHTHTLVVFCHKYVSNIYQQWLELIRDHPQLVTLHLLTLSYWAPISTNNTLSLIWYKPLDWSTLSHSLLTRKYLKYVRIYKNHALRCSPKTPRVLINMLTFVLLSREWRYCWLPL